MVRSIGGSSRGLEGRTRPTRRSFLRSGMAAAGLGFALGRLPLLGQICAAGPRPRGARADAILHILLRGGLSHLDSFDPKPHAPLEVRGELGTIASKLDGEPFCDRLRRTAAIADRLLVIRSMTHGEAAHERGMHIMLTGHPPSPALVYPSFGSVVSHELGGRESLPPYVAIPEASEDYLGTGYLGSAFAPFSVGGEPQRRDFRVRDLESPKGVDAARRERRRALLEALDSGFTEAAASDAALAAEAFHDQAWQMIESPVARAAFDLAAEPAKVRERYGRTNIGQRILLARRLVEAGVRYVAVQDESYDHHRDLYRVLPRKLDQLDQALAALVSDLGERGLLDRTVVLLTTEFGRTSQVNRDRGRDHWPRVFSTVVAGGGFRSGVVHGASNATGTEPERDPVAPADLAATLFHLLGIDPEKKLMSPGARPIDLVREGRVLRELLA